MLTAIEVTENQTIRVVTELVRKFNDKKVLLYTANAVSNRFNNDLHRCLREIMDIVCNRDDSVLILAYTHLWLADSHHLGGAEETSHDPTGLDTDTDDEDELDAAAVQGFNSDSFGLLYNLCHWIATRTDSKHKVYIVFEHKVPKRLETITGMILDEKMLSSGDVVETLTHATLPSVSYDRLTVVGVIGSVGKTSYLRSLSNEKSVWMYSHEIVNCELGESPRIVRSIFQTASGREKPSLVLLDDADLIMSSSGRIMREIIEEICACVSGEFSCGYFVYSSRSRKNIPDVLLANTNHFIDLDS